MNLATKITATLGVLFLMVGGTGGYSLWQMNAINTIHTNAQESWYPSYIAVQQINTAAASFRRNEIRHVHSEDPALLKALEHSMSYEYNRIALAIEQQVNMSDGQERVGWGALRDLWREYQTLHSSLIRVSNSYEQEFALQMLMGESNTLFNQFTEKLLGTLDNDRNFSTSANIASKEATRQLGIVLTLLMGVSLLLAVGLGRYLTQSTLKVLGKDPAELEMLACKAANGENPVSDNTATGVYADIITMASTLNTHVQFLESITANIPGGVGASLLDGNDTITYMSDGFLAMLGYERADMPMVFKQRFSSLLSAEERAKVRADLEMQLLEGDNVELKFSVAHKDGHMVWVLERGKRSRDSKGRTLLYSVLIDITELKEFQEQLQRQSEQCLAALCATSDFVFESTLNRSFVLHKGADKWEETFGPIPANYVEAMELTANLCLPDERADFEAVFSPSVLVKSLEKGVINFRRDQRLIKPGQESHTWFGCSVICFKNKHGGIDRMYGCISNINDRKQQERQILFSVQRDGLTGLYNKGYAEQEISWFLTGQGKSGVHALLMMDIDNFKAVNDNLGHLFGDAVLAEIAEAIRAIVRSSDIGGRIGGDEFVVLIKDTDDISALESKAEALCRALRRTYNGENTSYTISGSIGIALYPADAATYRELVQKADNALYMAKSLGKNRYSFYDPAQSANNSCPALVPIRTEIAHSEARSNFVDDVLSYIFELLYEARDISSIVPVALGMIGKHYGVSRAYVFQSSADERYCRKTFEWCNEGVEPQQGKFQDIACTEVARVLDLYTRDGVLYCEDISRLDPSARALLAGKNVRAMLHLAIFDDGKFKGYVGFDACEDTRLWTREEIATLSVLAKVLGVFLLKEEFSRRLLESSINIRTVLDSLNTWAYVIDHENRKLLYINAKTAALHPGTHLGETCHAAFFDSSTPCAFCPVDELLKGRASCTLELSNEKLGMWTLATASFIPWGALGHAVLMSCQDITRYNPQKAIS